MRWGELGWISFGGALLVICGDGVWLKKQLVVQLSQRGGLCTDIQQLKCVSIVQRLRKAFGQEQN